MTFFTTRTETLSKEEYDELVALKNAINLNPASVVPSHMERFTELLVRSWESDDEIVASKNKYSVKTIQMTNIDSHIQKDKELLEDPTLSPQMRRHTAEELTALQAYKEHHPNEDHDPTPLELYCDTHPAAPECRVYDD